MGGMPCKGMVTCHEKRCNPVTTLASMMSHALACLSDEVMYHGMTAQVNNACAHAHWMEEPPRTSLPSAPAWLPPSIPSAERPKASATSQHVRSNHPPGG